MKNFLLLLATAVSVNLSAQSSIQLTNKKTSTVLQPNSTIFTPSYADSVLKITIDIKNTSSSPKNYRAKRYDELLHATPNATASAFFCIAGTCYPSDTYVSGGVLTLNGKQSASEIIGEYQMLEADLYETESVGLSIVRYTFFNVDDISDSVQIVMNYNGSLAGIKESGKIVQSPFRLFPNPSTNGIVTVDASANVNKLEVVNLLGSTVLTQENIITGRHSLNVADLPAGTYFVKVADNKGTYTEKLIITK
jgi:hypothetical protein